MCLTAWTTSPVPASPLVRIMAGPSAMRRRASPRLRAPQTNGTLKACLSTWWASSAGGREHLGFVDVVHAQLFENLGFCEMSNTTFRHDRDGDGSHDLANLFGRGH